MQVGRYFLYFLVQWLSTLFLDIIYAGGSLPPYMFYTHFILMGSGLEVMIGLWYLYDCPQF